VREQTLEVTMKTIRAVAAASLLLASMGVAAPPALAATPDNDTYSGREVLLEPLPITVMADTTEATTDADDAELNMMCGAPATDASVWYEYTPSADRQLVLDPLASDYSVGAIVAIGSPGAWTVESCGPGVVPFFASSGMTYTILVFDDQVDGGGNGGTLEFTLDEAAAPPSIEVSVDPRGTFDARTGAATLTGTYSCAASEGGMVEFAFLDVQLSQRAGRLYIQGSGSMELLPCDGTQQPWTVTTEWSNGLFKGGKAEARIFAQACGTDSCGSFEEVQTVTLSARKK
jgi:hypothetical protein